MRYLKYYPSIPPEYQADVSRIYIAMLRISEYSDLECYLMWRNYSDSVCAGWIILPDTDKEIVEILTETVNDY